MRREKGALRWIDCRGIQIYRQQTIANWTANRLYIFIICLFMYYTASINFCNIPPLSFVFRWSMICLVATYNSNFSRQLFKAICSADCLARAKSLTPIYYGMRLHVFFLKVLLSVVKSENSVARQFWLLGCLYESLCRKSFQSLQYF